MRLSAKLGCTNVPHELESVEEDVEDQMVREKQLEEGKKEAEKRRQCVELPNPPLQSDSLTQMLTE
jgi:hypothetical protein